MNVCYYGKSAVSCDVLIVSLCPQLKKIVNVINIINNDNKIIIITIINVCYYR